MRSIGAGLAALLFATGAWAQDAPPQGAPEIVQPSWIKRPDGSALSAVYPAEARRRGLSGRGTISCGVSIEGTLQRCSVVQEEPAGMGFGAAALALAPQFRMSTRTVNGKPVSGGTVRIPITFQMAGGSSPRSATAMTDSDGGAPYVSKPIWTAAPAHADVAQVYPPALKAAGTSAGVQLDCGVQPGGKLNGCRVVAEDPRGSGAGRAAILLAPRFRLEAPRSPDGTPFRGLRVRFPVTFSPAGLGADAQQISRPEWGRLPQAAQVATLFPARAKAAGVKRGDVSLACRVAAGGAVQACSVSKETPAGMGFGEAALALAPSFAMSAWTSDGRPVDGATVRIPIRYEQ